MAQHDYVIANGTGAAVRSDLNNALAAIVSQNSGATEPATMYAYQWWADTSTGLLKLRNAANNAWITLRELDGTLTIEAGTVSAPGLAFASDLNTGIYSPSADQLAIATNGVERVEWGTTAVVFNDGGANYDFRIEGDTVDSLFFVDASADAVGLGTSTPNSPFEVGTLGINFDGAIAALPSSGADSAAFIARTASTGSAPFDQAGSIIYRPRVSATAGRSSHIFYTGSPSAIRMVINEAGNVGIGTTAPTNKLVVSDGGAGGFEIAPGSTAQTYSYNRNTSAYIQHTDLASSWLWNNGTSDRMVLDTSGRLLIGTSITTTDATVLINKNRGGGVGPHLVLGGFDTTAWSNDEEIGAIDFWNNDSGTNGIAAQVIAIRSSTLGEGGQLLFHTANSGGGALTERMRISSNGSIRTGNTITHTGATGAVTATTGTIVFSFDFSGTTTRHTAMVRLSVMHLAATNDINEQAAAEYVFAAQAYTTGAVVATSPAAVFQNQYVAATHFAFASTGNTAFTITLTEPTGTAASAVYYKVEILDNGSACSLTSVATT